MPCAAGEKRRHERAATREQSYLVTSAHKALAECQYMSLSTPRSHTVAKHKYPHKSPPEIPFEAIIPTKVAIKTLLWLAEAKNLRHTLEKAARL